MKKLFIKNVSQKTDLEKIVKNIIDEIKSEVFLAFSIPFLKINNWLNKIDSEFWKK